MAWIVNNVSIRYYISMDVLESQMLLERVSSLLRSESRSHLLSHGLQPVQFEALNYLSICNRYSDTPMGVTEYLSQTKGSVSQTLKVLEKKGLIEKNPDKSDKRVTRLSVTKAGRKLVNGLLPSPLLKLAAEQLAKSDKASTETMLRSLLTSMQQVNDFRTFGQCATCSYNIKHSAGKYTCGLTNEALNSRDIELICREHRPI